MKCGNIIRSSVYYVDDCETCHEYTHEPTESKCGRKRRDRWGNRHRQDETIYRILQEVSCPHDLGNPLLTIAISKCAPRLSPDAQEMLSSHFVSLRKQVQQVERDNDERSSIPITVR
jgi:DNA replicative helicase MCM subunit Mcm2 (Cdc46/Mcm family)